MPKPKAPTERELQLMRAILRVYRMVIAGPVRQGTPAAQRKRDAEVRKSVRAFAVSCFPDVDPALLLLADVEGDPSVH